MGFALISFRQPCLPVGFITSIASDVTRSIAMLYTSKYSGAWIASDYMFIRWEFARLLYVLVDPYPVYHPDNAFFCGNSDRVQRCYLLNLFRHLNQLPCTKQPLRFANEPTVHKESQIPLRWRQRSFLSHSGLLALRH